MVQACLGDCYRNGTGVEQDHAEAVRLHCTAQTPRSRQQGRARAQYNLGLCHADGIRVEQGPAEAVRWCRAAAEQGHTSAQKNLAICACYANGTITPFLSFFLSDWRRYKSG